MPSPWHVHKPAYQAVGKKLQLRQRVISNKKIRQDQLTLHSSISIRSPQFLRLLYSFSGLANSEQYEASLNRFVLLSVTILRFTLIGDKSGIKLAWYAARA